MNPRIYNFVFSYFRVFVLSAAEAWSQAVRGRLGMHA
jgi:hypothetical protein